MHNILTIMLLTLCCWGTQAQVALSATDIVTRDIVYQDGDIELTGYFARPANDALVPAVLVVHEWWGHNAYARMRAEQFAQAGYAAFALDMYGTGKATQDAKQAQEWATPFYQNNDLLLHRAQAGLTTLLAQPNIDTSNVVALGYCFGGTVSLQLARAGWDLKGVISYHGGLGTSTPAQADTLKARILVFHGGADPLVPPADVAALISELTAAKAQWNMEIFGTCLHAFTNPKSSPASGLPIAYDANADQRSMTHSLEFLAEVVPAQSK